MAIEGTLREFIADELAGLYTVSMVIVESVNSETRRCEVSMKQERNVILDDVPIASPYVGNETGVLWPVSEGDEGFVLHSRTPITDALEEDGHVELESDRRFQVEDAVLLPLVWNDQTTVPNHEVGEYLLAHESGTVIRISPDGKAEIQHQNGNVIRMNADGSVTLGDPSSAAALLNENAQITDGDGQQCTIDDPGTTDVDGS